MHVNFYATLRPIVGQKTVDINIPDGATIGQLITALVASYPALRPELLDDKGDLHGHIHFFVNGRDVVYLERQVDTVLHPDDVISVFPPVGGG
jgi:molybdopterin synthase sulfur carrier subunit